MYIMDMHVHVHMGYLIHSRELLEGMAAYEQQVMLDKANGSFSSSKPQLQPINFGGDDLLKKVINIIRESSKWENITSLHCTCHSLIKI